jgi:hypothetical protein
LVANYFGNQSKYGEDLLHECSIID